MVIPHVDEEQACQPSPDMAAPVAEMRIDGPHVREQESPPAELPEPSADAIVAAVPSSNGAESPPAPVGAPEADGQLARQLYTQATQLARELDLRQGDLDHREARLHVQIAQLEQSVRSARLWAGDKEAEITARLDEVRRHEHESRTRLNRLAAAEAALQRTGAVREQAFATREEAVRRHEAELASRDRLLVDQLAAYRAVRRDFETQQEKARDEQAYLRQQIDVRREASLELIRQLLAGVERRRQAVEARAEQIELRTRQAPASTAGSPSDEAAIDARWRKLEDAEARAEAERKTLREKLDVEQRQFQETMRAERHQLTLQQRRGMAALESQRQAVERRSEHVDQRQKALEQLRTEVSRVHRETLEIRLATEELWAQLSGVARDAKLTAMLGKIRARLADDYRLAGQDLDKQREELEGIRGELIEQQQTLLQQKRQLDQWAESVGYAET
jgi:DNA repair exonuclease SbcCD ATPase subunit